ncbi:hypothetical protein J5N97_016339 [Dioscorea zingiberensis]|uniref:KHDC4/BBP-like KH-domain type I domain-containing protein n=1 Tax=Dioscorea zingiberensis TaxID=325984 RepID=A0A9D5HFB0_9LILI|nr:hypothetical protein J5N97_016339 [Dioscorea zingiberensis]
MFGAKSGFVIPKNKLSGSLVPIYKSGGKADANDTSKEEIAKQVQRKTKWGTDHTQDAAVRKGRALAYQTLESESVSHQKHKSKKFEQLELEKREVIGELLRLNPSYKAPPDYKPLLKEAKVPIPVKAYSGYNFINLLLGPQSNTQKRLEQETGATIHVCGTKSGTGEKHVITQSEIKEAQDSFKDLYVSVLADTYEKIDAAVALIELLLTPVSGSLAVASTNPSSSAENTVDINGPNQIGSTSGYTTMPIGAHNPGMPQPVQVPMQSVAPQFQPYPGPWFQGASLNAPPHPSSGFVAPPVPTTSVSFPTSSTNPFNLPPSFQHLPMVQGPRTPSALSGPQIATQAVRQPPNLSLPPQSWPMLGQQPLQPPYSTQRQPTFLATQPMPTGIISSTWPPVSVNPQSRPVTPSTPSGSSSGWSGTTQQGVTLPQGPNTMIQMSSALPTIPRPQQTVYPSPVTSLPSQANNMPSVVAGRPSSVNFASPNVPSRTSVAPPAFSSPSMLLRMSSPAQAPMLLPSAAPAPVPPPALSFSQTRPLSQSIASQPLPSALNPVQIPGQPLRPAQPSLQPSTLRLGTNSVKLSTMSNPIPPPVIAPQRHHSSIDFTFQPLQGQVSACPNVPLPNIQPAVQNPNVLPPSAPQAPSQQPAMHNMAPPVGTQGFSRPPAVNQARPSLAPPSFGPMVGQPSPRFPPHHLSPSMVPAAHMAPQAFLQHPKHPTFPIRFPRPRIYSNLIRISLFL